MFIGASSSSQPKGMFRTVIERFWLVSGRKKFFVDDHLTCDSNSCQHTITIKYNTYHYGSKENGFIFECRVKSTQCGIAGCYNTETSNKPQGVQEEQNTQ